MSTFEIVASAAAAGLVLALAALFWGARRLLDALLEEGDYDDYEY